MPMRYTRKAPLAVSSLLKSSACSVTASGAPVGPFVALSSRLSRSEGRDSTLFDLKAARTVRVQSPQQGRRRRETGVSTSTAGAHARVPGVRGVCVCVYVCVVVVVCSGGGRGGGSNFFRAPSGFHAMHRAAEAPLPRVGGSGSTRPARGASGRLHWSVRAALTREEDEPGREEQDLGQQACVEVLAFELRVCMMRRRRRRRGFRSRLCCKVRTRAALLAMPGRTSGRVNAVARQPMPQRPLWRTSNRSEPPSPPPPCFYGTKRI